MKKYINGSALPLTLIASAIIGLLTITGIIMTPTYTHKGTDMYVDQSGKNLIPGEKFVINVIVSSDIPVNAYTGILEFDENKLTVDKIDYNTSIADLWAQEPWFNKGAGKIIFTGGTTKSGGFLGVGNLVTVTFVAKDTGLTTLKLTEARILKHDGLGTDAELPVPIDSVFTINANSNNPTANNTVIMTMPDTPDHSTDLNNDGETTLADISIFMLQLTTQNLRSDFNKDGSVGTADLSILLNNLK